MLGIVDLFLNVCDDIMADANICNDIRAGAFSSKIMDENKVRQIESTEPEFVEFQEPRNQSQGPIPTAYVACWTGATNTVVVLARQATLVESMPWNRILGSFNIYKFGLWVSLTCRLYSRTKPP
jgi:hypothetical protein